MQLTHALAKLYLRNIALGLLLCSISLGAFAQDKAKKPDIRLIIDVSGSMKKNDPNNLRLPAVDLLVRLLPEGSKAGVWTFGKFVNMLIPHRVVDEKWRTMAREKAKDINSVGLFTNIGGALEKAAHDKSRPNDKFNTSVILLTDGMVDVSKSPDDNQKEWRRIVDKVLPELKGANFTIHTVALSENADKNLLEKMSVLTDGTSAVAYTAEDLMKIFLKAFDVAAPSQQVPLEGNTFAVDSSVEEFTALIFKMNNEEPTQLIGPDKARYNAKTVNKDVSWLSTERYDLITVKRPVEGEWVLQADIDPDSRVTIVSDMTLRVKALPNNAFRGAEEKLSFVLQEDGKTITRADFLSLLHSTVTMAYGPKETPTGQIWSHEFDTKVISKRGVFRVAIPALKRMGVYDIRVEVDGKTFKRTFNHRITVREPFTASLEEGLDENGIEQHVLTVTSHGGDIDAKKTQIVATVINPKRRKSVKSLSLTEFDNWQAALRADVAGRYKVNVQITGKSIDGEPFEYSLAPLTIKYDPDAAFADEAVEDLVEDVVEEPPVEEPTPDEEASVEEFVDDAPEAEEDAVEAEDVVEEAIPSWVMYATLAFGNFILLGGGYFIFRKLSSSGSTEEDIDELSEVEPETEAPEIDDVEPPLEPLDEAPAQTPPTTSEAAMSMDDSAPEEEAAPPMEDLEGLLSVEPDPEPESVADSSADSAVDEMDMAQAMAMEAEAMAEPPVVDDEVEEDDFGVDDLEDEPEDTPPESEEDDLASEMLKAQGLDLAEDELDDAINNLIDDLDGDATEESPDDDLNDLSGIDFEEEE